MSRGSVGVRARFLRGPWLLLTTWLLLAPDAQARTPRLQAGATGVAGLGFGDFSRVTSGDTVEGTTMVSLAGAGLQGHARVAEHWAIGVVGQWMAAGTERNSANVDGGPGTFRRHFFAVNAEARWQFGDGAGTRPWASAGIGALVARDQWQSDGKDPGNAWQVAAAAVVGAGFDVPLTDAVALGLEVRSHVSNFAADSPKIPGLTFAGMGGGTVAATATRYQVTSLLTGSVVLRWSR